MLPRANRLLNQRSGIALRPHASHLPSATISAVRRSVASQAQVAQPPIHPEIDGTFNDLIGEGTMSMGMRPKGMGRTPIPHRNLDEIELADAQPVRRNGSKGSSLGLRIEESDLVIDDSPEGYNSASEREYYDFGREERRSPAAVLGSKRLGMVVLPEEMQRGIQRQIDLMDNPRDIRKSYLALPSVPTPISVAKSERRDKPYRTPEGELAKASAILPGEYGAVKNVLEELERRLGREWLTSVKEGEILEFSSSLGSGLWATMDVMGGLLSSRRRWQEGQDKLKYQFVHSSRHGLDLVQRIADVIPEESVDVQFNRRHVHSSTPSLILSTFHLTSFPTLPTRQLYLRQLLELSSPYIVLVERSTPQGWAAISQARSYLLEKSTSENPLHVVAPCPHDGKCPLVGTKDVCGYSQRLQRPSFLRKTKHSTRGEEEKGYCYLVIAKGERPSVGTVDENMKVAGRMGKVGREAAEKALIKSQGRSIIQEVEGHEAVMEVVHLHEMEPGMEKYFEGVLPSVNSDGLEESLRKEAYSWPRMVAPPMKRKGHVTMDTCCPDGNIQRLTYTKSHSKQSYHDARKSSWGDLFPHTSKGKPVIRTRGVRRLAKSGNSEDADVIISELLSASLEEEMELEKAMEAVEVDELKELEMLGIKIPRAEVSKEKQNDDVLMWQSNKNGPFASGQKRSYSTLTSTRSTSRPKASPLVQTRSMSARPFPPTKPKATLSSLLSLAKSGTPISVLTAYDYPTALLSESCNLDMTLVGDSLSQVALGHETTTAITLDEMIHHARTVVRGAKSPFVFADMPFGSFETSLEEGIKNVLRMVKEGGVDGVKIEGGREIVPLVRRLSAIGIPVMPHLGLQPQRATSLSGYLVQGRTAQAAYEILQSARELANAGAFAFLLEAMPSKVAKLVTEEVSKKGVFTIGIGAGNGTSGQVLVITDVLGVYAEDPTEDVATPIVTEETELVSTPRDLTKPLDAPRFVRQFGSLGQEMRRAVRAYVQAVKERSFPDSKESYGMKKEEWEAFLEMVKNEKIQH
ncbi:3-methyl-2-oxobutanoate hydroxymethyltransferase [Cryptococcus neoformans Gb118]|nr:3-methyl-2-oxobutanoate hydroxymethyltransferase [Cryptococcus neoformans var. grubii MW-RSA36]OXL06291.1 3-methyl-2-oxobutanoate hydroxymethyltransferase [Cryptococcus neoformans var. grubii Gb118]